MPSFTPSRRAVLIATGGLMANLGEAQAAKSDGSAPSSTTAPVFASEQPDGTPAMNLSTRDCALALRDGGIDAVAALDTALALALRDVPESERRDMKRAIGRAMGQVLDVTVFAAMRAFPELEPDEVTWKAVVQARATARVAMTK
jgi:hypothetical protein